MRLFIAVPPEQHIRLGLENLQKKFQTNFPSRNIKWVKPASMHLTVKFLGEVDDGIEKGISEILYDILPGFGPFHMDIKGTGIFPEIKNPRVLWIGCVEKNGKFINIKNIIDERLLKMSFASEKRDFSPHLTLARIKSRVGIGPFLEDFAASDADLGSMRVSGIQLIRSILKPSGAEYRVITDVSL